jgi:hypothetical protein
MKTQAATFFCKPAQSGLRFRARSRLCVAVRDVSSTPHCLPTLLNTQNSLAKL